jgi:hypothetical protein
MIRPAAPAPAPAPAAAATPPPPYFAVATPANRANNLRAGRAILARVVAKLGQSGRPALSAIMDRARAVLRSLAGRLVRGDLAPDEWFRKSGGTLATRGFAAALALIGGTARPPVPALEAVEQSVNVQAGYLVGFLAAITGGRLSSAQVVARAGNYSGSLWAIGQNAARLARRLMHAAEAGPGRRRRPAQERRLMDSTHPCTVCPQQAALGWQPLGTLKAIGDSPCREGCRCHFEFRP